MALLHKLSLGSGIELPDAYLRIERVDGNKSQAMIFLSIYKSKQALDDGKSTIEVRTFVFVTSVDEGAENFIKQGYEYLKTLPEFEHAIDV